MKLFVISKKKLIYSVIFLTYIQSYAQVDYSRSNSILNSHLMNKSEFASKSNIDVQNMSLQIEPYFVIGNTRFNFVGGFVPGWHFGIENCTPEINEDLIKTAKSNGINVLHIMMPIVEHQIGVFEESEIAKLDQFLFYAEKHGVYVMISFLHAYAIAIQPQYPYYNKRGIEGLIKDASLKQAFKKRMEFIITRKNSITGKKYFEDPTIMAWIIVDEPISAPWNYPEGPPNVTIQELKDWFEEMAIYIKNLDANHLVTVFTTAAIDQFGNDWPKAFDTPFLDFIEAEDGAFRILRFFNADPTEYPLRLLSLNKPLVIFQSFNSGELDLNIICHDYNWKASILRQAMNKYFDVGAGGVLLANWGSKLYTLVPSFDECYNHNSSIDTICNAIKEVASQHGSLYWPLPPLQFVKISSTTTFPNPPPAPVANSATDILQSNFTAHWNSSTSATGYRLDVATNIGFITFVSGFTDKDVSNVTTYNVTGLSANTTYYYRVKAYNTEGTGSPSGTIILKTLTNPSSVPSGLTASSCNDLVTLNWSKSTESDFLRYRIYGGTSNNPSTKIDSTTNGISDISKVISGLKRGNTYNFRVTAVNFDGVESGFSNQSTATVKTGVVPKIRAKWGDVLICSNLGDSITSFQWYKGGSAISGATKQYYETKKQVGSYKVEIVDKFGCKNSSNLLSISGTKSLSVYPNPASVSFALKISDESEGRAVVSIINSAGIKVMEFQVENMNDKLLKEIPVNNLDEGFYVVQVLLNHKDLYYTKIVVIK